MTRATARPAKRTRLVSGTTRSRNQLPRSASPSDKEQMFEQLARALLEFGDDLGLSHAAARNGIQRALGSYRRQPYRLQEALGFQELVRVSEVLGRWYREPRWLDEASQPLPLPLQGVRSFVSLCDGILPADKVPQIAREMLRLKTLVQDDEGRLLPRRRVAGTPSPHPWMLNRIPAISRAWYSTLAHNCHSPSTGEETRCERGTTVTIARDMAVEFNRQVKRLAHGLLDQIDDLAHSPAYQPQDESIQAGVEVFAYFDSNSPKAKP